MFSSKSLMSLLVAFAFSIQSTPLLANTTSKSGAEEVKGWNEQMNEMALSEAIRSTLFRYSLAGTPERFADTLMAHWSAEDREYFRKITRNIKTLPGVHNESHALFFTDSSGYQTKIEFLPGETKQFRVNGSMWSYNPKLPLAPQLDSILRNYPPQKKGAFLFDLLVPSAQAIEPITMSMLIVAVVTGLVVGSTTDILKQYGTHYICKYTLGNKGEHWYSVQPRNQGFCKDWDDNYKKSERMQAPKLDAIEQMIASDKSNVLTKFKVEQEYACPSNNDGKDRLYDAKISVAKTGKEFRVKINFTPQGKVKEYSVLNPEGEEIARVEFDVENFMKCAKTRNPKRDQTDNPLTPSEISLCRDNAALSTDEKGKLELIEDSARFLNLKISKCTTEAVAQKVEQGKQDQVGSPAAPKPNDTAIPSTNTNSQKPARGVSGAK